MLNILRLPDPGLRLPSQPVSRFDKEIEAFMDDLDALMRQPPGGVGIAAPQAGKSIRAIAIDCSLSKRPCPHHGPLYLINPEITACKGGEILGREGCLSVPDWVGLVPRARCVCVTYQGLAGEPQYLEAKGFEARVIQHEIDHLNGILFIDRMISTNDLVRRM